MCKILGKTTANYRWFAIVYLLLMFFVIPAMVLSLSLLGKTGAEQQLCFQFIPYIFHPQLSWL